MRGDDEQQLDVFSYISPEQRIPQDHPPRVVRSMTDEAFRDLKPRFNKLYSKTGRPSIAPVRALLLQVLYSVRSDPAFAASRWSGLPVRNAYFNLPQQAHDLLRRMLSPSCHNKLLSYQHLY